MGAIHIHLHSNQTKTRDRKVKDTSESELKALELRYNQMESGKTPIREQVALKKRIEELRKKLGTKDAVRLVPGKKYRLKNNKGIVTYLGPDSGGRHGDIKVKNSSGFTTSLHEDDIESEYTRDDSSDVERLRDRVRALERRAQLYNSAGGLPKSHPLKVELSQAREELKKAQTTAKRTTKWI